jgi:hypothetical protein
MRAFLENGFREQARIGESERLFDFGVSAPVAGSHEWLRVQPGGNCRRAASPHHVCASA